MDSKLCVRKIDLTQLAGEVLGQFVKATAMDALACGDTQCLAWLRSLCLTIRYNLPFNALATLNMAITLTNSMTDSQLDTLKDEVPDSPITCYSPITRHLAESVMDCVVSEILDKYPANSQSLSLFQRQALVDFLRVLKAICKFKIYGNHVNITTEELNEIYAVYNEALLNYEEQEDNDGKA